MTCARAITEKNYYLDLKPQRYQRTAVSNFIKIRRSHTLSKHNKI